jgi:hypothetical protein
MILAMLVILGFVWIWSVRIEGFENGGCCGSQFRSKKMMVNGKEIDLGYFHHILRKHDDMARQKIRPFMSPWEELGVSKTDFDMLLGA